MPGQIKNAKLKIKEVPIKVIYTDYCKNKYKHLYVSLRQKIRINEISKEITMLSRKIAIRDIKRRK